MKNIVWFDEISLEDINLVGGKNASLGEMIRNLSGSGVEIPNGFAITTLTYDNFLNFNNLSSKIATILENIDYDNHISLKRSGLKIRNFIQDGKFPQQLYDEIVANYRTLSSYYNDPDGKIQ